jgi:hypothetical protein
VTPTPLTERLAERLKALIAKWQSYIEKMRIGSVNLVHQSTKDVVQDYIEHADHFITDLQTLEPLVSGLDSLLTAEGDKITCHLTREQFDLLWTSKLNPSVSLAAARRAGMEEACVQICGACMRFGPQSSQLVAGEWMHGLPPCTELCKAAAIRKAMEEK